MSPQITPVWSVEDPTTIFKLKRPFWYLGKRRRKGKVMVKKIKVTINKTVYYNACVDDEKVIAACGINAKASEYAEFDQNLFRAGEIHWLDLFEPEDVTFEGVEVEED